MIFVRKESKHLGQMSLYEETTWHTSVLTNCLVTRLEPTCTFPVCTEMYGSNVLHSVM